MTHRRRVVAGAAIAFALLAVAPPAGADQPRGEWTSPAPAGSQDDVPVGYLLEPGPLQGEAEHSTGIANVSFLLSEDAAATGEPCSAASTARAQNQAYGNQPRVSFSFDATFPCNRRYQVRARVEPTPGGVGHGQSPTVVLNLWVAVAIPPSPVHGLIAEPLSGEGAGVAVSWDPDPEPEPDLEGFEIRRATGDAELTAIGEVEADATSFVDRTARPGRPYRYQVVAIRPGPDPGTSVFSEGEEVRVTTPAEPVTPGATTEPGGSGGSSGSTTPTRSAASEPSRRTFTPPARATPPTTADTGFGETLPFDGEAAAPGAPPGDGAVVAEFADDEGTGERDTLLLVAGGAAVFMWAVIIRVVLRRAAQPVGYG